MQLTLTTLQSRSLYLSTDSRCVYQVNLSFTDAHMWKFIYEPEKRIQFQMDQKKPFMFFLKPALSIRKGVQAGR